MSRMTTRRNERGLECVGVGRRWESVLSDACVSLVFGSIPFFLPLFRLASPRLAVLIIDKRG